MDLYSYAKAAFASLSDVSRVPFYRRLYEEFQFVPGYTWTRNGEWESPGSRGPRDVSLPGFSPSLSLTLSPICPFRISYTCTSVSLPQVSSPFLALAVYVLLSLAPADVRPSLPLLSLAPRRARPRTTGVWLTVYLKISIRLTRRVVPEDSGCFELSKLIFAHFLLIFL